MKALYWIISSAVAVAGLGMIGAGNVIAAKDAKTGVDISERFTDTKNMQITLGSTELKLVTDEKAEEVSVELHNVPKGTTVKQDNGTLIIQEKEQNFRMFSFGSMTKNNRSTATVTVPAGTELGGVEVSVGAADNSTISGLTMETFTFHLGSGSLAFADSTISGNGSYHIGSGRYTMERIQSGETQFRVGSGELRLDDLDCQSFVYDGGSGDLELTGCRTAGDFRMETASGSVKGSDVTVGGTTHVELASGMWNVSEFTPGANTGIKVASGSFHMGLTGEQADYSFNCKNSSGHTEIGEQSGKNLIVTGGDKQITAEGASGKIAFSFGGEAKTIQPAGNAGVDADDVDADDFDMDIND